MARVGAAPARGSVAEDRCDVGSTGLMVLEQKPVRRIGIDLHDSIRQQCGHEKGIVGRNHRVIVITNGTQTVLSRH